MGIPGGRTTVVALLVVGGIVGALAVDEFRSQGAPEGATVTVVDADGSTLGTVRVRVADTRRERYTGLSNTESLGPDEGMLFVHGSAGNYTYVMREMAFPIDIVFIGPDRHITVIHHAEVEDRPLTRYRGYGKWILEVPYEWTARNGVSPGDRVRIDLGGA